MKSKLLQKKSQSLTRQPDDVIVGQRENIEDAAKPVEATRTRAARSWLLVPSAS
jgi:hypothetical protein